MGTADSPDLKTIRSVVDRVIVELGPSATEREVHDTAALLLRELLHAPPIPARNVILLLDLPDPTEDVLPPPPALPAALAAHRRSGGAVWARTHLDLDAQAGAAAVPSHLERVSDLLGRAGGGTVGRMLLTLAPGRSRSALDGVPDLLASAPDLHIAVVAARPGLGVDRPVLDHVLRILGRLRDPQAGRLLAASMRLPLRRTGPLRVEVLAPASRPDDLADGALPEALRSAGSLAEPAGGLPHPVAAAVSVPMRTPSGTWIQWGRWSARNASLPGRLVRLRADGWPVEGVQPFRTSPLCAAGDDPAPYLLSLAAAGGTGPVCLHAGADGPSPPPRS